MYILLYVYTYTYQVCTLCAMFDVMFCHCYHFLGLQSTAPAGTAVLVFRCTCHAYICICSITYVVIDFYQR